MSERINVGLVAYGATAAMSDASLAFRGSIALRQAEIRLARARQDLASARADERRADARLARRELLDLLGL